MSIVSVLGESAVRSLALALTVWLVLRLLRVQHARIAKRAWTAVLILALAMPALVALHIPSFSFIALWATPQTIVVSSPLPVPAAQSFNVAAPFPQTPATPVEFAPAVALNIPVPHELQGPPVPVRHIALWQIGFAAYLTITALLLLRVLLGLSLAARLWRRAQPFSTSETLLPVRLSVDLRSPATVGHGILLPLEAVGWDDAALRATLAHEAQHIREGDFYLQLAATLHHCFFWISPHAWWLRPQLSRLSETICDRAAVASGEDGLSYAQLLIRLAVAEQAPAGMVAMAQSAGLRERVERLIADPQLIGAFRRRRGQAIAAAALLTAAALIAAASVHVVQPQTVVLAAPQAPAAPAVQPVIPTPDAVPAPPLPAVSVPDAVPPLPDEDMVFQAVPEVQVQASDLPPAIVTSETQIVPAPNVNVDVAPPVIAVGPMAMIQPPIKIHTHMKVLAMPHVLALQSGDNDVIFLNDHNYAICNPDAQGTVHDCSLNGYSLKDHKGGAILFERDGKTYVIDDPALVKEAKDAYAHVEELGKQQGALGEQQGKLGEQQGELGELQGKLGAMQGQLSGMEWHFDAPNFHFVMPENFDNEVQTYVDTTTRLALEQKLSEADRARLEAEQKEARAQFDKAMADWKAQQPQREAMEKQIREQTEQIRKQMQPLIEKMRALGAKQGDLGRMQGELGRQQALLGMQQRDASREADSKVKSLIDQAMKDGKARPVQ